MRDWLIELLGGIPAAKHLNKINTVRLHFLEEKVLLLKEMIKYRKELKTYMKEIAVLKDEIEEFKHLLEERDAGV